MRLVIIESPYQHTEIRDLTNNIQYARVCVSHSLSLGEAPLASHLLYTQVGILDDTNEHQRKLGISAGYAWGDVASLHVFYTDRGWSEGMLLALDRCTRLKYEIELRSLTGKSQLPPNPNKAIE